MRLLRHRLATASGQFTAAQVTQRHVHEGSWLNSSANQLKIIDSHNETLVNTNQSKEATGIGQAGGAGEVT